MPSIFEQMDKNTSLSKLAGSVSRMPSGSIMNLSLSCLEDMPDNDVVFTYKEDIINELVERIQEIGFKDPIKVMPIEHGKYRIISGHQRKIAAERLGWESVPCIVYRDLDERQARDLWRDENMLNRKKTPYLYAQVLKTYLDDYAAFHEGGGSYRYAAKKCGISKSQVPRYLLILDFPEFIQKECDSFDFPYTALEQAKDFTKEQKQRLSNRLEQYSLDHPNLIIEGSQVKAYIREIEEDEKYDHQPGEMEDKYEVIQKGQNKEVTQWKSDSYERYKDRLKEEAPVVPPDQLQVVDDVLQTSAKALYNITSSAHFSVLNRNAAENCIRMLKECIREVEKVMK